jgi:hypothetical protein
MERLNVTDIMHELKGPRGNFYRDGEALRCGVTSLLVGDLFACFPVTTVVPAGSVLITPRGQRLDVREDEHAEIMLTL